MRKSTQGMRYTTEYNTWRNMKARCYNKNCPDYKYYGGRGITVCDEWINDFMSFYNHVGNKQSPELSIDRINNEGNYEPGNVRWATDEQQLRNRRPQYNEAKHGTRTMADKYKCKCFECVDFMKSYRTLNKVRINKSQQKLKEKNLFISANCW